MRYDRWVAMSHAERDQIYRMALAGDSESIAIIRDTNNSIARAVNGRLSALEREGFDSGEYYERATNFTDVMYGTNRFRGSNQLRRDVYDMYAQMQEGVRFLRSRHSRVSFRAEQERRAFELFKKKGIFTDEDSVEDKREFLRFLGNKFTQEFFKNYGKSDQTIEAIREAFRKNSDEITTAGDVLEEAFRRFSHGDKEELYNIEKLREAFDELGVVYNA